MAAAAALIQMATHRGGAATPDGSQDLKMQPGEPRGGPLQESVAGGGYDIGQLSAVREICHVPLVASGGAGAVEHFRDAFERAAVDAALAASVFHTGEIAVKDLKLALARSGIAMRCG